MIITGFPKSNVLKAYLIVIYAKHGGQNFNEPRNYKLKMLTLFGYIEKIRATHHNKSIYKFTEKTHATFRLLEKLENRTKIIHRK